jgi:hypothetical protein
MEPLVDRGEMPHLESMINRGVMGGVTSSLPMVCPILWTSIATGVFADRHGILTMVEPDGYGDVRPVQSTSRRRKAIWNILSQNDLRSIVIGWPATHPAERINGVVLSDRYPHTSGPAAELWPADDDAVHPRELMEHLLGLRLLPEQLTRKQLASFVPRLSELGQEKHKEIGCVANLLAQVASVQQAATWAATHIEWDFLAVYYGMLGSLSHDFLQYHSPPSEAGNDQDRTPFGSVMETAYRLHDMMLGRLLELAGPDTVIMVVSDHGFHRNRAAADRGRQGHGGMVGPFQVRLDCVRRHRRDAFLCAAGPGLKEDELVFGTQLVDIAPTILTCLGLPVPDDMDGRVIADLFRKPPSPERVGTYEARSDGDGVHSPVLTEDPWAAHEMVENLSALGIVELDTEAAVALETCTQQRWLNLAELCCSLGRYAEGLAAYRELGQMDESPARIPIVTCLMNLGRLDEARQELEAMTVKGLPGTAPVLFLWARLHAEEGETETARMYLERAESLDPDSLTVPVGAGWLALRLGQHEWAVRLFERVLVRDPEMAQAHDGLGVAMLRLGRVEESVFHHMQSVRFLYHRSGAHLRLGEALMAAGQLDWASRAFEIALALDPGNTHARKSLVRIRHVRGSGDQ